MENLNWDGLKAISVVYTGVLFLQVRQKYSEILKKKQ